MTIQLLQPGQGTTRDLVLVYHIDPSKTGAKVAAAAGPGACVVVETLPPFKGSYLSGHGLTPLAEAVTRAMQLAGGFQVGNLVLVGFSEGCQALRSHLMAGNLPSALLAVDGVHASKPPEPWQLAPWRQFADLAKSYQRVFTLSHTAIVPPNYASTTEVAPLVAQFTPGQVQHLENGPGRTTDTQGLLTVEGYPGADGPAHVAQQVQYLAPMLSTVLAEAHGGAFPARVVGLAGGTFGDDSGAGGAPGGGDTGGGGSQGSSGGTGEGPHESTGEEGGAPGAHPETGDPGGAGGAPGGGSTGGAGGAAGGAGGAPGGGSTGGAGGAAGGAGGRPANGGKTPAGGSTGGAGGAAGGGKTPAGGSTAGGSTGGSTPASGGGGGIAFFGAAFFAGLLALSKVKKGR